MSQDISARVNDSVRSFSPSKEGNLDAYFDRIGYGGSTNNSLSTLADLHRLHPQSIPFENLNPFFQVPVLLDNTSIHNKLIHSRRGGYCFEQNLLLSGILKELGFKVKGLAARVMWNIPEGVVTARGHMLLCVEVENEKYIVDVGFGGLTLTSPLRLISDVEQPTSHETFKLTEVDEEYVLHANVKGEWKALYKFGLQEQFLPDYEVTNWYLSNHPSSHFVTGIIAAKTTSSARYALRGKDLAIHHMGGATERRQLSGVAELKTVLETTFGIDLSSFIDVDKSLEKVFA